MSGSADIIITVRSQGSRGGWDVSGWLGLETVDLDPSGAWAVTASCGCVATQVSWRRCHEHERLEVLYIQARLQFAVAES